MAQITDKVISKVYEGKVLEGKGQYFNFYLEGGKKKYGYFVAKGKVAPNEGMKIAVMEYETKQDGEYENNKVTKLVWMGADQPTVSAKSTTASAGDKASPIWFCLSYAKDLEVALIQAGKSEFDSLQQIGLHVSSVAIDMLRFIQNPAELMPKDKPVDIIKEAQESNILDEPIPF
jgi:hypothetical protein